MLCEEQFTLHKVLESKTILFLYNVKNLIFFRYNIRPSNGVLYQSLNFTIRLCSSSSDSSSSDSDSDNEKAKPRRKYDKSSAMLDNKNLQNLGNIIEVNNYNFFIALC